MGRVKVIVNLAMLNLGSDYCCLGDFKKAIEYHILHLKTVKEVGDKYGEG